MLYRIHILGGRTKLNDGFIDSVQSNLDFFYTLLTLLEDLLTRSFVLQWVFGDGQWMWNAGVVQLSENC